MSNVHVILPDIPFAQSEANAFLVSRGTFISIAFHLAIFIFLIILSYPRSRTELVLTEITLVEQIIPMPDPIEPARSMAKGSAHAPNGSEAFKIFQPNPSFKIPDLQRFKPREAISEMPVANPDLVGKKIGKALAPPELAFQLGSGLRPGAVNANPAGSLPMVKYTRRELSDMPLIVPARLKPAITAKSEPALPNQRAGVFQIFGDLSGRKILSMALPKYPRWAEEQGLESSVTLKISVDGTGKVLPNILIESSSGYPELDNLAMDSVRQFVFTASERIVSGYVRFNFSLRK